MVAVYNGNLVKGPLAYRAELTQKRVRPAGALHVPGTQKQVRWRAKPATRSRSQKWVRRRNRYADTSRCRRSEAGAETGTLWQGFSQKWVRRRGSRCKLCTGARTCFCVDNRLAMQLSTVFGREPALQRAWRPGISQNRVRFAGSCLWRSLWAMAVIPAESGSRWPQIQVRVVADTGSARR